MKYYPCKTCGERTFAYHMHPLLPDANGDWTPEEFWTHLYPPAREHAAIPVLDPPRGQLTG